MFPGRFLRVHRVHQERERTSRLAQKLPRPRQTSSGYSAQLLRFLICERFSPLTDITVGRDQPKVYGIFDSKNDFIDSVELRMVALYLANRPSTDSVELKAG